MLEGGFFSKEETGTGYTLAKLTGCAACGLNKGCQSPKLEMSGKGEKRILIISEIPCQSEDQAGRYFLGEASKMLKNKLAALGINIEKDCKKVAAVGCYTPEGRAPDKSEIEMCRPRILQIIEEYNPVLILLLGNSALGSVIGSRWKKDLGNITQWRGWTIPDREFKAWICPIFAPVYVMKSLEDRSRTYNPVVEVVFDKDLRRAVECLDRLFPIDGNEEGRVTILDSPRELVRELDSMLEWRQPIAIDFETTGLKPDSPLQELVSCSISLDDQTAFAFDVYSLDRNGPVFRRLKQVFYDNRIKKWAHNSKFEDRWADAFDLKIRGWEWCSMLAAHTLDNRSNICSLKFQVYVQFGMADYDSHIAPYLKSVDDGAHALNTIMQAPRTERLIYNGVDTIFGYRLSELQMPLLEKGAFQ